MPRKPRTSQIDRAEFYEITGRLQHFACFYCRKAFKQPFSQDAEYLCPQCRQPMTNMGTDFKAPPQKDVQQWRKVEALARAGVRFFPSYPGGLPGKRPETLAEVPTFLRQLRTPSTGERLLEHKPQHSPVPREGRLIQHGQFPQQIYSLLGVPLKSGSAVELFQSGRWRLMSFVCKGNGGVPIPQPYAYPRKGNTVFWSQTPFFLTEQHRLRWPQ